MKKLIWIDAVRGYAVLGVLMVHSIMGYKGIFGEEFLGLGAKGVQLFYMASAFTLLLSHHNRKNEESSFKSFYIRRFFRIAPMFWLAIIYYLFQNYGHIYDVSDYRHITNLSIFSHFLFLHGFSPYWQDSVVPGGWSVGVEFIFYFICPFIFYFINNRKKALFFYIVSFFFSNIISYILLKNPLIPYNDTWRGYIYGFFPGQLHVFSLGVLVYFLSKEKSSTSLKTITIIVGILTPILFCSHYYFNISSGQEANFIISIFFAIFILLNNYYKLPIISNKLIVFLGKISYSIYLVHFAVVYWLEFFHFDNIFYNPTLSYILRFLIIFTISTLISYITYRIIEKPFIKIGSSINKKI